MATDTERASNISICPGTAKPADTPRHYIVVAGSTCFLPIRDRRGLGDVAGFSRLASGNGSASLPASVQVDEHGEEVRDRRHEDRELDREEERHRHRH